MGISATVISRLFSGRLDQDCSGYRPYPLSRPLSGSRYTLSAPLPGCIHPFAGLCPAEITVADFTNLPDKPAVRNRKDLAERPANLSFFFLYLYNRLLKEGADFPGKQNVKHET